MQIKETPDVSFPGVVESSPLEDVIVLADSAGVALVVQRAFIARVRSVHDDGSGLTASRCVEIPVVGRNGEISGVLCWTAPRSDTRGVFPSRGLEGAKAIGDVAQFVVHDINNLLAVIGSGLRLTGSAMELMIPPGRLDRPVDQETDHVLGPADAEITLVEYGSYACPLSFQAAYAAPVIMMSQNQQQDIDRKAAGNDYRINVTAELEIELLHEKIDQLREREVLKLTEAVRMLTELLKQSASAARDPDAEGGRPS